MSEAAACLLALLCGGVTASCARRELAAPWTWALGLCFFAILLGAALLVFVGVAPVRAAVFGGAVAACGLILEIDRRHHIIPDRLTALLLALALAAPPSGGLPAQLLGAIGLGALFLGVRWTYARLHRQEGLGLGDVKLATAMGAMLGLWLGLAAVAAAAMATALALASRSRQNRAAPFGISLATALAVALFFDLQR